MTSAPRGALVMDHHTGPSGLSRVPGMGTSQPASLKITPAGGAPIDDGAANARTVGTSGGAMVASQPQIVAPAKKGPPWALLAIGALALGGGAAYLALGRGGEPAAKPDASANAAASTSTVAAPPSGSAAAPVAKTGACPPGMIKIPGGKMFMGARDLPDQALAKPPHEVSVSEFCVDKTEVTTKAYFECVDRGDCERPLEQVSWPNISEDAKKKFSGFCNAGKRAENGDHPINCVAWPMADNFCKKSKRRLPTEAEWEFAARGSSQRKYPWGDDPPAAKYLNACGKECAKWGESNGDARKTMYDEDDGFAGTAPVGKFPAGASAHGVLDLAGNVWEWTADWYAPYSAEQVTDPKGPKEGQQRVLRGGDFLGSDSNWARPAWRYKTDPETYNHAIGFRCAADPG